MAEKTYGIRIITSFDGKGFTEANAQAQQTGAVAKAAAATTQQSFNKATAETTDALNKTSATGKIAFQSIAAAAAQAGSGLGPVVGGINSMFAALAAGSPVIIAVTLAVTALGIVISRVGQNSREVAAAQKEMSDSVRQTGVATEEMYAKLSRLNDGLNQTQSRFRDFQRQLGDGMIPVLNLTTGEWEKLSAAVAKDAGWERFGLQIENTTTLLRNAPTVEQYRVQIEYLQEAIANAGNEVTRGALVEKLSAINDEFDRLKGAGANVSGAIARMAELGPSVKAPVIPLVTVDETTDPVATEKQNADAIREARNRLLLDLDAAEKRSATNRMATAEEVKAAFLADTQFMQNAFGTAVQTMTDFEMTGKQRREAIMKSLTSSFIMQIGQRVQRHIFGEMAKRAATQATATAQAATTASIAAKEIGHVVAMGARWLALAATKIYAFYAALGPFGIPAAAATVAAMVAGIRALKFQHGGIVPGSGFGDRVPAMLEPGERVIPRGQYAGNAPAIERAISGRQGGGNTINVSVNDPGRRMSVGDILEIESLFDRWFAPRFEQMLDRREIRSGLSLP